MMSKLLQKLAAAGLGTFRNTIYHDKYSDEIWNYDSNSCEISIFNKGLIFLDKRINARFEVPFAEIQSVESSLTAQVLSNASKDNIICSLVPLKITTFDACLILDLPIQIYSSVLITIRELCGK
jgi:hypothetical protein